MRAQFLTTAWKLRFLVALIVTLFMINRTCAQNITVTTDPIFWDQSIVNGNLTITGDELTNLGGLNGGVFGGAALTQVTGDLIIGKE